MGNTNSCTFAPFMKKLLSSVLVFLFLTVTVLGQKDRVWGSWSSISVQYEFVKDWTFYFETQTRSHAMYNHFHYYEFKGGFSYKINKYFSALVGFGNYGTYDWKNIRGMKTQDELRLWEQFVINQSISRVKLEHRIRFEQASINKKYRNRFRYRLNVTVPLNSKTVEKNTIFAAGFSELFLTDTPPYFMRHRVYLGLGYQVTDYLSIQSGWINQFNYTFDKKGAKNYFMLNLAFKISKKEQKSENIPTPLPY